MPYAPTSDRIGPEARLTAVDHEPDRIRARCPRRTGHLLAAGLLTGGLLLGPLACSTREESAVPMPDSTWVYPSKRAEDVIALITFSQRGGTPPVSVERASAKKSSKKKRGAAKTRKSSRKAAPIEPRAFDIQEGASVVARVHLEDPHARGERPLLFHLVWLKPSMKTAYKKSVEVDPNDGDGALVSSISIPPSKRVPGIYTFRVYLYRELIAEKTFELRGEGLEENEEEGEGI